MFIGNSLVVQRLVLGVFTTRDRGREGLGLIPGWGTKILQATQHGGKKRDNIQLPNILAIILAPVAITKYTGWWLN